MLKKLFAVCMTMCTFFTFSMTVMAGELEINIDAKMNPGIESVEDSILEFFNLEASDAISKIEKDFISSYGEEEGNKSAYQGLSFLPEQSYKVYTLDNENIVSVYAENLNLGENISDTYILKTPIQNSANEVIGVASFYKINGTYKLGAYEKMDEQQVILSDSMSLKSTLSSTTNHNFSNVQDMKAFVMNKYNTYAIFIATSDGEYVIPISSTSMFTTLTEDKVYAASDFIETLSQNSQESMSGTNSSEIQYGNNISTEKSSVNKNIVMIVISVVGIVCVFVIIKKNSLFCKKRR